MNMIHYHGTPCGATRKDVERFLSGRHALIPWGRHEDIGTAAEVCQSFCVDNGAFTAWKQGKAITNWTPYYAFVAFWQQHPAFDWAIIPDVIDGDEQENDLLVRQWPLGRNVGVPVWHLHESMRRLEYLAGHFPRIALGSSGKWATPGTRRWWERIDRAMEVLCDEEGRPKTKLHGLRMLDAAIFTRMPLASADSTNAVRNSSSVKRFGMYVPPNASTRMHIIAERIEQHQSAAIWRPITEQPVLCYEEFALESGT